MCRLLLAVTLRYRDVMNPDDSYRALATQYHVQLPPHLRAYLNARAISDAIIDRFLLGFDGTRITVPAVTGVSPRSEFMMAFSMTDTILGSQGVTLRVRASSTATLAVWLIGTWEP